MLCYYSNGQYHMLKGFFFFSTFFFFPDFHSHNFSLFKCYFLLLLFKQHCKYFILQNDCGCFLSYTTSQKFGHTKLSPHLHPVKDILIKDYALPCDSIHTPFPALKPGIKMYFWGRVPFDLHVVLMTLNVQNIYIFVWHKHCVCVNIFTWHCK